MNRLTPSSQYTHIIHGFKTGIAAVLAYILTVYVLNLSYGYWAALSAVIVMQINIADSIRMCWYRFSGTAIGAFMGILCIVIFPQTPSMILLSLFLSVAFCAFMTKYNEFYRMAAITVTIITLASLGQDNRIEFGLYRVLEISIGVACAFVTSIMIFPMRASESLNERIRIQFKECAVHFETLMESFLQKQSGLAPDMLDSFTSQVALNRDLYAKVLRHERLIYIENTDLLGLKVRTLEKNASHLNAMLQALNDVQGEGYEIIMKKELKALSITIAQSMCDISSEKSLNEKDLQIVFDSVQERLEVLRNEGATKRFYLQKILQFFVFYHNTQFICKDLLQYAKEEHKTAEEYQYI
ncbi:FUSC family protein [Maridesulfovibrio frigidus]|uniref:FUSC family protein n=1 Tax=Maridesulfovibrio frigidus TaxID=340956 RepID=UPI0004E10BEC|nr:FUSC family protein [Maridesulfovibrio frigidus]